MKGSCTLTIGGGVRIKKGEALTVVAFSNSRRHPSNPAWRDAYNPDQESYREAITFQHAVLRGVFVRDDAASLPLREPKDLQTALNTGVSPCTTAHVCVCLRHCARAAPPQRHGATAGAGRRSLVAVLLIPAFLREDPAAVYGDFT